MLKYSCPICSGEGKINKTHYPAIIGPLEIMDEFDVFTFTCSECGYSSRNEKLEKLTEEIELIRNQPWKDNPAWKILSAELQKQLGHVPTVKDVLEFGGKFGSL